MPGGIVGLAKETVFWSQTAPDFPGLSPLRDNLSCDVAVIGGGLTGLRAALDLADGGAQVVLLEAGDIAQGASGRSGGQVNPMLPVDRPDTLRAAVGTTYFDRMCDAALGSADALFALIRRLGIACDARQAGWVRADHCPRAAGIARENARLWNAHGAGFEVLEADAVEVMTGAKGYVSGVLSPKGGAVQPLALTRGLATACLRAGARIFKRSPVTRMQRDGQRWTLTSGAHHVTAAQVVVATNGYSDGLVPGLKRSVLTLHPIQIATDPLPEERLQSILPEGHTISDTRRLIMYARREATGQIVFGGIGFNLWGLGRRGYAWLMQDAPKIFPSLRGVTWRYRWGGRIALTADRVPHLHEPMPGLTVGLGYNGRGVAMSSIMGGELARRASGIPASDLTFPVTDISPYPAARLQSLGAGLGMAALRMRDRLDIAGWTGQSFTQGVQ
ncbi:FAD-dependent oxidoreductase [Jannaschia pagri]|uniref:FAD-dependent oxidoreductase n=1 Tax=Jannaschia pagri TaxID=2829797 RepID=A0ABQ4NNQ4_9RHOB|nr:FAD-dependent oxidoreductase [Jannaschia sp. AI_62]GIT92208.1 FAD-dependent oxidoreductase [Jannaschia sp. AI_61]GIT96043.1 FAD-dependent oxidoreductase [Jannaschia sp. AI_62]